MTRFPMVSTPRAPKKKDVSKEKCTYTEGPRRGDAVETHARALRFMPMLQRFKLAFR